MYLRLKVVTSLPVIIQLCYGSMQLHQRLLLMKQCCAHFHLKMMIEYFLNTDQMSRKTTLTTMAIWRRVTRNVLYKDKHKRCSQLCIMWQRAVPTIKNNIHSTSKSDFDNLLKRIQTSWTGEHNTKAQTQGIRTGRCICNDQRVK